MVPDTNGDVKGKELSTDKGFDSGEKLKGERPEAPVHHVCLSSQDKNEDNGNKEANNGGASQRSEPIHHLHEKITRSEDLPTGNESKKWKSKLLAGPTIAVSLLVDSSRGQNGEGNTRNQMTEGTTGPPMVGPQVMPQPLRALLAEECSSPQRISSRTLVRRDSSADQSNLRLHHPMKLMEATLPNGKSKRLYWRPEEEDMLKEEVQSFSSNTNKNLTWRKILEYGHYHVLDETLYAFRP